MTSLFFPIYGQFRAIRKPDYGRIFCKTYIFINSNLFFIQKYSSRAIALSKAAIFAKKCRFFYKKMLTSAKLRGPWYQKIYIVFTIKNVKNKQIVLQYIINVIQSMFFLNIRCYSSYSISKLILLPD